MRLLVDARRLIVLALVAAIVAGLGLSAASEAGKRPAAKPVKQREIVALRTRSSKTYATKDGRRVAKVWGGAVHFKNRRGRWQDVDTTLRRAHGRLLNRTNNFSVSLPADIGSDGFRVRRKNWWVEFSLRGARGAAQASGSVAKYPNALPGVDATYRVMGDSLKENLVLRGPDSRKRFVFDLRMRAGLRPSLLKTKGVVLKDRRNRTRMTIAAPFTIDRNGRRHRAVVRLNNVGGRWRLTLRASDRWLAQRNRAWPVTLDPAIYPNGDADCDFGPNDPSAHCADAGLWVGRADGYDHYQAAMRFDGLAAAIPRGADVQGATLSLYQYQGGSGTATKVNVHALTEPFNASATWWSNNGTDRWSEPGGEADTGLQGTAEVLPNMGAGARWMNVHMWKIVRDWASGKRANHGLLLKGSTSTSDWSKIRSADEANTSLRPYLTVVYQPRTGDRRGYVHERQQLTDRISLGVNVASGNLNVSQTDFSMPGGLGPAVSVGRAYNSLAPASGALGNWTLNGGRDLRVEEFGDGAYVTLHYPGGAKVPYTRKDGSTTDYDTPPGYDNKLTRDNANGTYLLTDNASQTKMRFAATASAGRLNEIEDRNGRKLTFVYDGSNQLSRIEDSNNDTGTTNDDVRFTHSSGQITAMNDPGGRAYAYAYTSGKLTSYTDPQNGSSYKTLYEYNGPDGQLSKITTPQGSITTVEYYDSGANDGRVKAVTRVTNTSTLTGNRTEFDYTVKPDGSGQARVTDPIGVATADENDRVTTSEFDTEGRVTKTFDALGRETARKLTTNSNVESYTAAGNTGTTPNTTFSYESSTNNLLGTSTPTNANGTAPMTTAMKYGGQAGDNGGSINAGTPGSQYMLTRSDNEQGGVTKVNYTTAGDTNGNPSGVAQYKSDATTLVAGVSMQYAPTSIDGKKGQLASITDGRGKQTHYGYDAKGNVNSIDPPGSGANQLGTTSITYDPNLNRVSKVTDGKGNKRLLTYDSLDRLQKIEFTGTDETLGGTEPKVEYTYDRDGNQTSEVTREEGTGTSRTRSMTYDTVNRVTYESLPGGASNTYTYDAVGNLRSITDGGGKTEYTYDAVNQVRSVYEPGATKPTKFEHNKDGLRTSTRYPNNVQMAYGYDHASRLTSITSTGPSGTLQDFAYKYVQPSSAGSRQTPLRYETEDKTLGRRTRYAYDGLDRLELAVTKTNVGTADDTGWAGPSPIASYGYTLDGAGNITQRVVGGSGLTANTTNFYYDEGNQLCWRSPTSGATTITPCAAGTRQTSFDGNGNETTGANGTNRTATYHLTDQTKTFTISGSPTSFIYLGAGQDRWIQEGSATFQHNVLGVGRRSSGGTDTYFTRDEGGGLVSNRAGSTKEYYLFDALGSVSGKTNGSTGALTARYDYEPYGGREMSATGASGSSDVPTGEFGYAGGYKSVGGMYHFGQRFYDAHAMRWTQADAYNQPGDLTQGNRFQYAGTDPANHVDLDGLLRVKKQLIPPRVTILLNRSETIRARNGLGIMAGGCAIAGVSICGGIAGLSAALLTAAEHEGFCVKITSQLSDPRPTAGVYKCP